MLKIKNFYFNDLHECCSVAWDGTGECVIIDPGFYTDTERDQLKGFIGEKGLKPVRILLTHAHFDHVFGLKECAQMYGIPVYMDPADKETLQSADWYCRQFGFRTPRTDVKTEDLHDGDTGNSKSCRHRDTPRAESVFWTVQTKCFSAAIRFLPAASDVRTTRRETMTG